MCSENGLRVFLGIIGFITSVALVVAVVQYLVIKIYNYAKSRFEQKEGSRLEKK